MKKPVESVIIMGGGVVGWFTAALLARRHPDIKLTVIESPKVPILGVGESTIPQLGDLLDNVGINEFDWMKGVHGIHKLGNHFVGWNTEQPMNMARDHWYAPKDTQQFYTFSYTFREQAFKRSFYHKWTNDDFFLDNDNVYGVDAKSHDYWLEMVRQGKAKWWEVSDYLSEQYAFAMNNKSAYDMNNDLLIGNWHSYAWHVDAERFPKMIRDMVALPCGVEWVKQHVQSITHEEDGYIKELVLDTGQTIGADLYVDCTGFNRVLMKAVDAKWIDVEHLPTQSAWVAPVRYNDPHTEMKPYTQSYAMANGWVFMITLFSRMGSGYIFDINSEDADSARERFIRYWDDHQLIREPRLLQWDQGYYKEAWMKNVVGVGMGQGFIDPMEANSIYVAQSCMEMLDKALRKYNGRNIPELAKGAYTRQVQKLENQIADFISYHFTLSKRRDHPMWQKWGQYGMDNDHVAKNWHEYRAPRGYLGSNIFLDYQWAQQQHYLGQWNAKCESDIRVDPALMPLAEIDFRYLKDKSRALADYAPNIYEWAKTNLYEGATHTEVLEQALAER